MRAGDADRVEHGGREGRLARQLADGYDGISVPPIPGASNAIVRKPSRCASSGSHARTSPQMPMMSSSGGPSPRTSTRVRNPLTISRSEPAMRTSDASPPQGSRNPP